MTDIQRHLKLIVKTCRELPDDIVMRLREVLPDGYGVVNGSIAGEQFQSVGQSFIIYDRALTGDHNEASLDIEHVLMTGSVHDRLTQTELMMDMKSIARIKELKGEQSSKIRKQRPHVSQQRDHIPRARLPVGLIYINEFDTQLSSLITTLREFPIYQRPDFIYLDNLDLVQRNSLLDKSTADGYEIGLVRQGRMSKPHMCYVCKQLFQRQHFFYEALCPDCGDFNYLKRTARVGLSGRIALVTGGRIRIGYATALRLLRNGAHVIVTTRFPKDAARCFAQEDDFDSWSQRLDIYGLDLRFPPDVEEFVRYLYEIYPHLDILINNAAQTIRHPESYYESLIEGEQETLPAQLQTLLFPKFGVPNPGALVPFEAENGLDKPVSDAIVPSSGKNSWVMRLEELSMPEVVEVQLINSVAPALLCGQLRDLMTGTQLGYSWIINVSSVEGQFDNNNKRHGYHPHTNMAKAALNMLTRTIATDFAKSGILVNSVDPGWISDQFPSASRTKFPIDTDDAAARLCDPIFSVIQGQQAESGQFLKDYRPVQW